MKKLNLPILTVCSMMLAAGCTQNPDSHNAETSAAQEVQDVSMTAAQYSIDTTSSQLNWNGFKPTGHHYGTIGIESGSVAVEGDQVVGGNFIINLQDIDVQDLEGEDEQKLAGHLKSEDFFHVEKFPTAKFEITKVEPYSTGATADSDSKNKTVVVNKQEVSEYKIDNPTHMITGNLTLRDSTLSISFPAEVSVSDNQVEAMAKFNIDRTKWGVSYNDEGDPTRVAQDKFIYNTVNIGFDIVAGKEAAAAPAM